MPPSSLSSQHLAVSLPLAAGLAAGTVLGALGCSTYRQLSTYTPPKIWTNDAPTGGKFANINKPTSGAQNDTELKKGKHMLQLHSLGTPNGVKVTILLEELVETIPDFDYDAYTVNIMQADQFTAGFVGINPNSKIPALIDYGVKSSVTGVEGTRVFESAAILMYLCEKFDTPLTQQLYPKDLAKRAEVTSWVMWQMGSAPYIGGGFGHFYSYAPSKMEYPINRFTMEAKRQLHVLETVLTHNKYICGDEYTLADIAIWPWYGSLALGKLYSAGEFLNVEQDYPNLIRWAEMLESSRVAVRRGRMVNRSWGGLEDRADYAGIGPLLDRNSKEDWKTSCDLKGKNFKKL